MRSLALLAALALSLALVSPAGIGAAGTPADASTAVDAPNDSGADAVASAQTDVTNERAVAPAQTNATNESNRTRVLVVPDGAVQRSEIDTASLDLGPAAQFNGNVTAVEVETAAVVEYIESADTDSEKSRRIIEASSDVETEIITLRDRQQTAIQSFNEGDLTAEQFVVELATIAAKADALETRMNRLTDLADDVEGFSLARPAEIRYELRAFGGPVREQAIGAIRGTENTTQFFVTTGPEGYELATIVDGTYHREAFRGAVQSGDGDATMSPSEAINVTQESYPEIARQGDPSATTSGTTNIVTITADNRQLTAFVDSGTERVFKEYQRFDLTAYDTGETTSNTISGITVTVNRTYPGGPLQITVTDAETGEPIDLAITLSQGQAERTTIGRTGDDGTIWAVSPRGSYTVLAVGDETTAAYVETNATDAPAIED